MTSSTAKNKPRTRTSKRRTSARKPDLTARRADKHVLYQLSVQDSKVEVDFLEQVFKKLNKRKPERLLEHFCGSALICSEWVKRGPGRHATGVDIDASVLAWGKKHNVSTAGEAAERVTLLRQDVRDELPEKYEAACALNFSYWIFRNREEMRRYFAHVRKYLTKDGIFVIDAYGGWEAMEPKEERRRVKGGFTYVWDQNQFDPITHEVVNYIHFEFRDGTKMKKAFEYRWRFWTLPELGELLEEAGYSEVRVYWDANLETDEDEEDFRPAERARNHPGWLAYLVARR